MENLRHLPGLATVVGLEPATRRYYFWTADAEKVPSLGSVLMWLEKSRSQQRLRFYWRKEPGHSWTYRWVARLRGMGNSAWTVYGQFDMTPYIYKNLVPALTLSLLLVLILSASWWSLIGMNSRRLDEALQDLEKSVALVYTGNYDLNEKEVYARQFTVTQRMANLILNLLHYFKENVQRKEIEHQRDKLTGLYTRAYFIEGLEKEIKRTKRYQRPLSFIIADIDHFKNFNDSYGHLMGDKVLARTAQLLLENTRETDVVARYGGEEICIILSETNIKEAMLVAENLRKLVESAKFIYQDTSVHVTLSFGVTSYVGGESDTVQALIQRADKALYEAKQSGRNQVRKNI